jgi:DNA-binding response OmpR family regulator
VIVAGGAVVVVVGVTREPTTTLAADLRRLDYRPEVIAWPADPLRPVGARPLATVVDFRVLGPEAAQACRAARQESTLRRSPVIAFVPEQEGARVDPALGFDDLILAPYRLSDLAARLRLLRWRAEQKASPEVIRAGAVTLNQATYKVAVNGVPVELTLKEYQLLLFLMRHAGRVFTRAELLDRVWGEEYYGGTRTVDVHIRRLRAKTEAAGELLDTIRGVGYRLFAPSEQGG